MWRPHTNKGRTFTARLPWAAWLLLDSSTIIVVSLVGHYCKGTKTTLIIGIRRKNLVCLYTYLVWVKTLPVEHTTQAQASWDQHTRQRGTGTWQQPPPLSQPYTSATHKVRQLLQSKTKKSCRSNKYTTYRTTIICEFVQSECVVWDSNLY